jgi:hypothetical protein
MQKQQRIVVMPFKGERGDRATNFTRSYISQGRFHTLVEGTRSATSQRELDKAAAANDQAVLANAGSEGATVIIEGSTSDDSANYHVETSKYKCKKTVCVARDGKGNCTKNGEQETWCASIDESCLASVTGKIIRVADNQVALERTVDDTETHKESLMEETPNARGRALCSEAFETALQWWGRYLTPYSLRTELDFHKVDKDGGAVEEALKHVKVSKFDAAAKIFEGLVAKAELEEKPRAWARFDLGKVYYALAKFDDCAAQMEQAQGILDDSDVETWLGLCRDYIQ